MSFPREAITLRVKGPFGARVVGVAAGIFSVKNVDEFLRKLTEIDRRGGTVTQAFKASCISGIEHLIHAARLAIIANKNKTGFADSLAIELICWAAAERQIGRAFDKIGVRSGRNGLAILSIGTSRSQVISTISKIFQEFAAEWDNTLLELKSEKILEIQKIFSISQDETKIATIQKIVLERIALLALMK